MTIAPTRGAVDSTRGGWVERRGVALFIRIALLLAPILLGWFAVRVTKGAYWQPAGWGGVVLWIIQAMIIAGSVSYLAARVARRLAPLVALYQATLVFPDSAPSRLGVALRSGTLKKLNAEAQLSTTSTQEAAEQAVVLVNRLGKHERLTRGHTERVRAYAELIGIEMGLSDEELQKLRWGVMLHDIGKLRVPARILSKEGKLEDHEWEVLRQHPAHGAKILEPLAEWLGEWVHAADQHHERWDGAGYPLGLSGTDISLAGRITAVADAFDVITAKRSYKEALSPKAAREELVRCAGGQFDPAVVRAALQIGLRDQVGGGFFSWVAELPAFTRIAALASNAASTAVGTAASTAAVASIAVAASLGGTDDVDSAPSAMALSASDFAELDGAIPGDTDAAGIIEAAVAEAAAAQGESQGARIGSDAQQPLDASEQFEATDSASPAGSDPADASDDQDADALDDGSAVDDAVDAAADAADVVASSSTTVAPDGPNTGLPVTQAPTPTTSTTIVPGPGANGPDRNAPTQSTTTTTRPRATTTTTTTTSAPLATTTTTTTTAPTTTAPTTTAPTTTAPTTTTTTSTTTTMPPPQLPTGSPIQILAGNDVPDDLRPDAITSDSLVFVVEEQQEVTLQAGVVVDDLAQGVRSRAFRTKKKTLPAGTVVCSWLVRLDAPAGQDGGVSIDATIDFNAPVIGVALRSAEVRGSNVLGVPGVPYDQFALEQWDWVTVTGSTVRAELSIGGDATDQMRVITSC